jgi:hypothetical protein
MSNNQQQQNKKHTTEPHLLRVHSNRSVDQRSSRSVEATANWYRQGGHSCKVTPVNKCQ